MHSELQDSGTSQKRSLPRYKKEQIEKRAIDLINYVDTSILMTPQPTPLDRICAKLEESSLKARFIFDQDLGTTPNGNPVIGTFKTVECAIYVAPKLPTARHRWVLAHELGHLTLHRKLHTYDPAMLAEIGIADANLEIRDTMRHLDDYLAAREIKGRNQRQWLEWQANTFAAALLLPEQTFLKEYNRILKAENVRNWQAGTLYVDNQPCNYLTLHNVAHQLSVLFLTTKTTVIYRLHRFDRIIDVRSKNVVQVSELLHILEYLAQRSE